MINWNRRAYSKDEFIEAWNSSRSIAECLRRIHKADRGGNYRVAKETAEELGLSDEHMTGQGWNRGYMIPRPAAPLEEILVEGSKVGSTPLRLRLLRSGHFEHKCYRCDRTEWEGQPIPLELEHINGVHRDNRIENLTLLCPNCHAQTPTYRGKNKASVGQRRAGILKISDEEQSIAGSTPATCTCKCGTVITKRSRSCRDCVQKKTVIVWPDLDTLLQMVEDSNYSQVGKQLGVSDNAVRKAIKRMKPSS